MEFTTDKFASKTMTHGPIQQVLRELSDLPEEPTESRRKATSLYSVMTLSKVCIALRILEHVMAHTSILS